MSSEFSSITPNLMVGDVNETIDYYQSVLGFDLIMSVPESGVRNWAMMKKGDVSIMFQEKGNLVSEYPDLADREPGSGLTLFIKVKDVSSLFESLKPKADLCSELHETFYGTKEFAITDCNGFILTFAE